MTEKKLEKKKIYQMPVRTSGDSITGYKERRFFKVKNTLRTWEYRQRQIHFILFRVFVFHLFFCCFLRNSDDEEIKNWPWILRSQVKVNGICDRFYYVKAKMKMEEVDKFRIVETGPNISWGPYFRIQKL